jgi:hypothetical protein
MLSAQPKRSANVSASIPSGVSSRALHATIPGRRPAASAAS